LRNSFIYD